MTASATTRTDDDPRAHPNRRDGQDSTVTETYTYDISGRRTDTSIDRAQVDGCESTVHTQTKYDLGAVLITLMGLWLCYDSTHPAAH